MKKIVLSLFVALLSFGSAIAAPQFKGLSNKHGKTTIKVEIPASDRDASNGLSIDNIKLHNNGKILSAKKVDAIWGGKLNKAPSPAENRPERMPTYA